MADAEAIAERQHGLVSLAQARGSGLSKRQVELRVERGTWERVRPRVYLVRGAPRSWPQSVMSAVLAAPEPAFASHRTAARLWRLPVEHGASIEITTMLDRRVRIPGVVAHRSGLWDERDVASVVGVPVTSPARTLVDLSDALTEDELGTALDEGLRRRSLSLNAFEAVTRRFAMAPGRSPQNMEAVLRTRVPGYDPGDSQLETRVWEAIGAAGLPSPERRVPVRIGHVRYVLDLAYPAPRIAIEIDGFAFHRERSDFVRDRERQNALVLAGWTVLRFTTTTTDSDVVRAVRRALSFGHSATHGVAE